VEGTVVDADGEPAEGVRVQIGDDVETTDVEGRFVVGGAGATYDAAVVARAPRAYVFQSLTTRTPTLRVFDLALSLKSHETHVHARLDAALPENGKMVVTCAPAEAGLRVADVRATAALDGSVDVVVRWLGGPRARVRLSAVAYEADGVTLAPSRYLGVASADATLDHLETATWDVALAPVETDALHAHVAPAPGHAVEWTTLYLDGGAGAPRVKLADRLGADRDVDFLVPRLEGARFAVEAIAKGHEDLALAATGGLDAGHAEARLALPRAPALRAPADGATAVSRDTEFSWEPRGVSWVYFGPEDQTRTDVAAVWMATPSPSTKLPDLRALGVELPAGTRAAWYVVLARGAATVEDAAATGLFADAPGKGGNTAVRRFVTE
jgi:hypothetical protein